MRKFVISAVSASSIIVAVVVLGGAQAGASPTCVDLFGGAIANHGQHIVGDYIAGIGYGEWPAPGAVGEAVGGRGPFTSPGSPGIQLHGASPGASFCTGSSSPSSPPGNP